MGIKQTNSKQAQEIHRILAGMAVVVSSLEGKSCQQGCQTKAHIQAVREQSNPLVLRLESLTTVSSSLAQAAHRASCPRLRQHCKHTGNQGPRAPEAERT
eukprot:6072940-Prymnesium_polylepis.1